MGDALAPLLTSFPQAAAWCLVAARAAGVGFTAPTLAAPGLDWRFRLASALALGAWTAPLASATVPATGSAFGLFWLIVNEALIGAMLGLSASLVVAGARQAGDLVSAQAGLSTASLFDPETGEELTALGHLYGLIAIVVFLAMDGPLQIIDALLRSFHAIPAGRMVFEAAAVRELFGQVAEALKLAVRAAAPAALALATAGMALGWLGRMAPSVPLMALSLPLRSALGVLLVMAGLIALATCLDGAWLAWVESY